MSEFPPDDRSGFKFSILNRNDNGLSAKTAGIRGLAIEYNATSNYNIPMRRVYTHVLQRYFTRVYYAAKRIVEFWLFFFFGFANGSTTGGWNVSRAFTSRGLLVIFFFFGFRAFGPRHTERDRGSKSERDDERNNGEKKKRWLMCDARAYCEHSTVRNESK